VDGDGSDLFNVKPEAFRLFLQFVADIARRPKRRISKGTLWIR